MYLKWLSQPLGKDAHSGLCCGWSGVVMLLFSCGGMMSYDRVSRVLDLRPVYRRQTQSELFTTVGTETTVPFEVRVCVRGWFCVVVCCDRDMWC